MKKTITLLDGAVGTTLWAIAERNGVEKIPVWIYNMTHPEFVEESTRRYFASGSKIILTNTFGANRLMVAREGNYTVKQVVTKAVQIARGILDNTDVVVCLAIGPLSELLEPYGEMTECECEDIFDEMMSAGISAGAQAIMIQTFIDLKMMEIAARVAKRFGVPVYCTMSFEAVGKTMFGNSVKDVISALEPLEVDGIGVNCSLGPELATPIIREFAKETSLPLVFKPNAGKPIINDDGTVVTEYDVKTFVEDIRPALDVVSFIGGCCGSDDTYISEIKKLIDKRSFII